MITQKSVFTNKLWRWCLTIACGLMAVYLSFVCLLSIFVGLTHKQQPAFWLPILAGVMSLIAILWGFLKITRKIFSQKREEVSANVLHKKI